MDLSISHCVGLLAVAIVVAIITRRVHLPYTVGLVFTGMGLALAKVETGVTLSHDLIFDVILPPLLFEAALAISWVEFRRDAFPVLVLATLGVIISALVVAAGMIALLGWPMPSALVFGVLIAATDPVAVIAMFKDAGTGGRLRLLVESESLLNDGVAAVVFAIVVAWAEAGGGEATPPAQILQALAVTIGGGVFLGSLCGLTAMFVAGRTDDHLVETAMTAVAAYGSFLAAENLHFSGVLATVAAGLVMNSLGERDESARQWLSRHGRDFVESFWEFAAFIANSLIFLLIGVTVAAMPFGQLGWISLGGINLLVLMGRAASVYPLCGIFSYSRWAVPLAQQHVLWWGGLRGALALALALALPTSLAWRNEIVIAAFGVVAFSVLLQGLTMPMILKRFDPETL